MLYFRIHQTTRIFPLGTEFLFITAVVFSRFYILRFINIINVSYQMFIKLVNKT